MMFFFVFFFVFYRDMCLILHVIQTVDCGIITRNCNIFDVF